jgi:hypothetical protein
VGHYRFVTTFRLDAPRAAVRRTVLDPVAWAADVTDVLDVTLREPGDATGVGRRLDASIRAPLGYQLSASLEIVEVRADRIALTSTGDLVGSGVWQLDEVADGTAVRFSFDVDADVRWMRLLEPVARPVFVASHGVVMRRACRAAAAHLGADLRAFATGEVGSRSVSGGR